MSEQMVELERCTSALETQPDGYRMTEHLAEDPRAQMPQVSGPSALSSVTLHQLPDHCLDPATHLRQPVRPTDSRILTTFFWGSHQDQVLFAQSPLPVRRPVVAIGQSPAVGSLQQFWERVQVMDIGWSNYDLGNDSRSQL